MKTYTDIDGNSYSTIIIDDMEWMAENLRVTRFRNGDSIKLIPHTSSNGQNEPAWGYYNDNPTYNLSDGKLYNGYTFIDSSGLCPTGWHASSEQDWQKLISLLGGPTLAGFQLVSNATFLNQIKPHPNTIGFSALAAGEFSYGGSRTKGNNATFGTSKYNGTFNVNNGRYYWLRVNPGSTIGLTDSRLYWHSACRCVKNP